MGGGVGGWWAAWEEGGENAAGVHISIAAEQVLMVDARLGSGIGVHISIITPSSEVQGSRLQVSDTAACWLSSTDAL